jgi:Mn-dependent DtxR family transcriptional regulator
MRFRKRLSTSPSTTHNDPSSSGHRDRAESNTILLTQEFLSEMLGVRRTSVTDGASKMQAVGAISYSRGVIKVIDLGKLRNMSCERDA